MKIPVQKLVVRNGQQHTQTYWEEDDKNADQPSLLANLGVPRLKPQKTATSFPVDAALQKQWDETGRDVFAEEDAEAAIAAGLSPNAAASLQSGLPEWESLANHIYENNMDEMPRPKGGWQNKDGHRASDQRWAWENAGISMEDAAKWADAGFTHPWTGIPNLIRAGVPLERAIEWEKDSQEETGRFDGARLYLASTELNSDISLEEAYEYRRAFHGDTKSRMGYRELQFYKAGVPAKEAAAWNKAVGEYIGLDKIDSLRKLGWTPAKVRAAAKEITGQSGKYTFADDYTLAQLEKATPELGSSKLVMEWLQTARISKPVGDSDLFPPHVVKSIKEAEVYKERFRRETGIKMEPKDNYGLSSLLPLQRDALIDLFKDENRSNTVLEDDIMEKSMDLAKIVASSENLSILREHGFEFGDPATKEPYRISYGTAAYATFDATRADEHSRNKWMKEVAFRLYSKSVRQQEQRDRWNNDDNVDPVRLREALQADPKADDVKLDALLVANISNPVVGGWL